MMIKKLRWYYVDLVCLELFPESDGRQTHRQYSRIKAAAEGYPRYRECLVSLLVVDSLCYRDNLNKDL